MDNHILKVRIVSPKGIIFQGQAVSVSSINSAGKFDILPGHTSFLTLTKNVPVTINTDQKKLMTFNLPMAVIFTAQNSVRIYTDINFKPNLIDE
ncbi:hypothetical protein HYW46_01315 [Candidatus Daviesbacteria bacterium]|nr:hypothetical protein [Candidatus Daviesbacteria bacterium]